MPHLLTDLDATLDSWATEHQLPKYRRGQMRKWLFEKRVRDWDTMSDLPKALREQLTNELPIWSTEIAKHTAADDGTEKLLISLGADGQESPGQVECVLLRENVTRGKSNVVGVPRRTVCVSTQVGCGMGCVFCASGLDGVERNLTTGEIIEQFLRLQHHLAEDERLSHIVVMGMGEPLANLDNLLPALEEASREDGLGISPRRITISTVGLPKQIIRLADAAPRYRLAISLHAPNDELRNQIVPTNNKIGIEAILDAADYFFEQSKRRLTFEYVLLADLNDQPQHAHQLLRLLRNRDCLLNVIPYNPVDGLPYATPTMAAQKAFRQVLDDAGLPVRFRHRKGDKINAACGQLRRQVMTGEPDVVPITL